MKQLYDCTSPAGLTELSPAIYRWEGKKQQESPGGTTEFNQTHISNRIRYHASEESLDILPQSSACDDAPPDC